MTKADELQKIREQLEADYASLPLVTKATDTVPGEGNPNAEIMFIGEAAGRNEALLRRPFVGLAGKLVDKQLEAIGIPRKEVYISNVVKCRPPDNRDPLPEEIAAFAPYLDKEIEVVNPKLIITLGRFSMGKFIPDVKISQIHGRLHKVKFQGQLRFVLPFYHPAAAMRQGKVMEMFVADFQKVPKILAYVKTKEADEAFVDDIKDALL
ncbi:MAG: uracil-DNA glycosylase [Candidatus Pacebacteria bacterium]|nr:uracil-DNA glycosylase [Candidatus Paceibacterota bacterium]